MMEVPLLLKLALLVVGTSGQLASNDWGPFSEYESEDIPLDLFEGQPQPPLEIQKGVMFKLYTRNNHWDPESMNPITMSRTKSRSRFFNPDNPIRICIHETHAREEELAPLRKAYLGQGRNNVIMMNWTYVDRFSYRSSRALVPQLGKWLAHFINLLVDIYDVRKRQLHVIGFGLGAHIASVAGRYSPCGRITGLDPAGPLFFPGGHDTLHPDTADFVDVIHTAGKGSGLYEPLGHVDFYPNGGTIQPGCSFDLRNPCCSHARAIDLFAESITSSGKLKFWSTAYEDGPQGNFPTNKQTAVMGDQVDSRTRGVFFLRTAAHPPYAIRSRKYSWPWYFYRPVSSKYDLKNNTHIDTRMGDIPDDEDDSSSSS